MTKMFISFRMLELNYKAHTCMAVFKGRGEPSHPTLGEKITFHWGMDDKSNMIKSGTISSRDYIETTHSVLLESDISFVDFCEKLKNYLPELGPFSLHKNNCAFATSQCLKLAGIDLHPIVDQEVNYSYLARGLFVPKQCINIPTPYAYLTAAKIYKGKQIGESHRQQYKNALEKLKTKMENTHVSLQLFLNFLISEIETQLLSSPERINTFTYLLNYTDYLISNRLNANKAEFITNYLKDLRFILGEKSEFIKNKLATSGFLCACLTYTGCATYIASHLLLPIKSNFLELMFLNSQTACAVSTFCCFILSGLYPKSEVKLPVNIEKSFQYYLFQNHKKEQRGPEVIVMSKEDVTEKKTF